MADFYKPDDASAPKRIVSMSPLVVREIAGPKTNDQFGTSIEAALWKEGTAEASRPAVYYLEDNASVAGVDRNRLSFLWLCDKWRGDDDRLMRMEGIRMTLDENGYAIFWEVLAPTPPRVVYVAQSVEDAAADEFGPPEPQRRFSIELPFDQAPDVVVPRILADGPQPMGPFVYLDSARSRVTTLLCRCMPSQVADFRDNQYFELRRLPAGDTDAGGLAMQFHELLTHADALPLETCVRIPAKFATVP